MHVVLCCDPSVKLGELVASLEVDIKEETSLLHKMVGSRSRPPLRAQGWEKLVKMCLIPILACPKVISLADHMAT